MSGEALFKGDPKSAQSNLAVETGVDAKSETGGFQVPSFSGTFSGAKTTVGG